MAADPDVPLHKHLVVQHPTGRPGDDLLELVEHPVDMPHRTMVVMREHNWEMVAEALQSAGVSGWRETTLKVCGAQPREG